MKIASIHGRKYLFKTDIDQEFLDGLIQTFIKKRVNQSVKNFTNFCKIAFDVDVKLVDNVLGYKVIKVKK